MAGLRRTKSPVFEAGAGLVDLVVCVGRHFGGGHRFALAGERFVDLVAADLAEVGDRGGDFRERQYGEGTEREIGDCGCRFVVTRAAESGPPLRSARWVWPGLATDGPGSVRPGWATPTPGRSVLRADTSGSANSRGRDVHRGVRGRRRELR